MSNQILIKHTATPGKVPATTDIALGELAVNTNDGVLFFKKNVAGVDTVLSINPSQAGGVSSVNGNTGAVIVSPATIGAINTNQLEIANGVATLDSTGKLKSAQIPSMSVPIATASVLGGVKDGAGLDIAAD